MSYFNIVAQTNENTVVTEYEPVKKRSDEYLARRQRLTEEADQIKTELESEEQRHRELQAAGADPDPEVQQFLEAVNLYKSREPVSNEMVRTFIKKVLVYEPGKIEIVWNFSDSVAGMMEKQVEGELL